MGSENGVIPQALRREQDPNILARISIASHPARLYPSIKPLIAVPVPSESRIGYSPFRRRGIRARLAAGVLGTSLAIAGTGCTQETNGTLSPVYETSYLVQYADGVMQDLGAPATSANEISFSDWAHREGMSDSDNNPLATTLWVSGASSMDSVGVRVYPTIDVGEQATADTIKGYQDLWDAFKSGNGVCGGDFSVSFSKWSNGGYSSLNCLTEKKHYHQHHGEGSRRGRRLPSNCYVATLGSGDTLCKLKNGTYYDRTLHRNVGR